MIAHVLYEELWHFHLPGFESEDCGFMPRCLFWQVVAVHPREPMQRVIQVLALLKECERSI